MRGGVGVGWGDTVAGMAKNGVHCVSYLLNQKDICNKFMQIALTNMFIQV